VFPFKNHVLSKKYMILKSKHSHHRHISFFLSVFHGKKKKDFGLVHFWMKSIHRWRNVREALSKCEPILFHPEEGSTQRHSVRISRVLVLASDTFPLETCNPICTLHTYGNLQSCPAEISILLKSCQKSSWSEETGQRISRGTHLLTSEHWYFYIHFTIISTGWPCFSAPV